jgi:hypothetical protein
MAIRDPELPPFLFSKTPFHDTRGTFEFTTSTSSLTAPPPTPGDINKFYCQKERAEYSKDLFHAANKDLIPGTSTKQSLRDI